jgi:DNA repair protein RAD51
MAMEEQRDQHVEEEMEEEPGGCAVPIEALQAQGIAAADIKKLREGNIYTVEGLAHACKKELTSIKGISEAKVEKMQKEGKRRRVIAAQ